MSNSRDSPCQRPQRHAASTITSESLYQQFNSTQHSPSCHQQQQNTTGNDHLTERQQQQQRSARLTTATTIDNSAVQSSESNVHATNQQRVEEVPLVSSRTTTATLMTHSTPAQPDTISRKRSRQGTEASSSSSSINGSNDNDGARSDHDDTLVSNVASRVTKRLCNTPKGTNTILEPLSNDCRNQRKNQSTESNSSADALFKNSQKELADLVPSHLYRKARSNPEIRAAVQSMPVWRNICRVQNIEIFDRLQQPETVQHLIIDYYASAIPHIRSTCDHCLTRLTKKIPLSVQVSCDAPLRRLCANCLATLREKQQQQMTNRRLSLITRLELLEKQGFNIDYEKSRIFNDYTDTIYPKEQSEDMIIGQLIREARFNRRWKHGEFIQTKTDGIEKTLTRQNKVARSNYIKYRGPLRNDFEKVIRKAFGMHGWIPSFTNGQYEDAMCWLERQTLRYQDDIRQDFPSAGQEVCNTLAFCYYAQSRVCHRCFSSNAKHDINQDIMDPAPVYFWNEIASINRDIVKVYSKKCVNEGFRILRDDKDFYSHILKYGRHNPIGNDIRQAMEIGARYFESLEIERVGGEFAMDAEYGELNTYLRETLGSANEYHNFIVNEVSPQFRREGGHFVHV